MANWKDEILEHAAGVHGWGSQKYHEIAIHVAAAEDAFVKLASYGYHFEKKSVGVPAKPAPVATLVVDSDGTTTVEREAPPPPPVEDPTAPAELFPTQE